MTPADTPMPGEDPGALIEDEDRLDEIEPRTEEEPGTDDRARGRPGSPDEPARPAVGTARPRS